jgi:hypothetical protein
MSQDPPHNPPSSPSEPTQPELNSSPANEETAPADGQREPQAEAVQQPQAEVPQELFMQPQATYLPPGFAQPPPGIVLLPAGANPGAFPVQFAAQQSITAQFRSSPFPPSQELEVMERLQPGSTKRIFDLVEQRQNAEIELAKSGQGFQRNDTRRGNWMGFVTILGTVVLSTFLFYSGHDVGGTALLGADVLGIGAGLYMQKPDVFAFFRRKAAEQPATTPPPNQQDQLPTSSSPPNSD